LRIRSFPYLALGVSQFRHRPGQAFLAILESVAHPMQIALEALEVVFFAAFRGQVVQGEVSLLEALALPVQAADAAQGQHVAGKCGKRGEQDEHGRQEQHQGRGRGFAPGPVKGEQEAERRRHSEQQQRGRDLAAHRHLGQGVQKAVGRGGPGAHVHGRRRLIHGAGRLHQAAPSHSSTRFLPAFFAA
jgi:hypothetical protein